MREIPFDRYTVIAADLILDHGPAALSPVAEEHRQAKIAGDHPLTNDESPGR